MEVLWSRGASATVRDVLQKLIGERALAYTTVMTVLDTLHRKGWVRRARDGRAYRYEPTVDRAAYTARMMSEVLAGSPDTSAVFLHLVSQMSPEDTAGLRAALRGTPGDAS